MKKLWKIGLALGLTGAVSLAAVSISINSANALTLQEGAEAARCDGCPTNLFGNNGVFKQITNTILYVVGIISVVMLIIGGVKYLVSGGDAKKVTEAKNTVLYAIIGLIIALLSFAIVNFVISVLPSMTSGNPDSTNTTTNSADANTTDPANPGA